MEIKNILAIETSCDDTCMAIIDNGKIKLNIINSSAKLQNKYGGVVPELAAREHEINIIKTFKQVIDKYELNKIDAIAYTNEPGLRVSLNIGEAFATTISKLLNKPLIKINHIYSHIFSFCEDINEEIIFPFISLVASGGHTSIYLVNSYTEIKLLNETTDDAIGECYDKIARELKLGYPGGPFIDKLYDKNKTNIKFLKNMPQPNSNFSFSGLKTSILNFINQSNMKNEIIDVVSIASSFQKEVIDIVINKMEYYINLYKPKAIAVGGGVSANKYLKERLNLLNVEHFYFPKSLKMSTDNAAMIGIYAALLNIK